jgi:uncharacterized protein
MKLRIAALQDGANPVEEGLSPAELGLDEAHFQDPVRVTGTAVRDENHVDLRLQVETVGQFVCDRCARDFERPFSVPVRVQVMMRNAADALEEEEEGLLFVGPNAETADLSDDIAQALLLDLPIQVLHAPDCKGLCPRCYVDLNEEEHEPGCPLAEEDA